MKDSVDRRFQSLIGEGRKLMEHLPGALAPNNDWISTDHLSDYQAWLTSAVNLLRVVSPPDGQYGRECERLLASDSLRTGIPVRTVSRVYGLLRAGQDDWNGGLLRNLEFVIVAQTFDRFLEHAHEFQVKGMKEESAILASVVLEDTLRKIAAKNGVDVAGLTLDPMVDELAKHNVINSVKAKRIKALSGIRNKALHALPNEYDLHDAKSLIEGTRELIDKYLAEGA